MTIADYEALILIFGSQSLWYCPKKKNLEFWKYYMHFIGWVTEESVIASSCKWSWYQIIKLLHAKPQY